MGELPKRLLAWLAKLLPKQEVRGDGAVQVGRVDGDLHTDHSTHHHTARVAQSGHIGTGAVHMGHVQNVTQVHQHFYGPAQPTPSPAPVRQPSVATPDQKQVLALMGSLPEPVRFKVLDFMRQEFGTAMVIELSPGEAFRVRKYVEKIHSRRREKA